MALTHLLDTSIYSQPVRDVPLDTVMLRWSAIPESSLCIAALVHAELLQGLIARNSSKYWRRYRELLEGQYPVIPFDKAVAETFSQLAADARSSGKPRPLADMMIAATALHHGLIVATLNEKDFAGIPGLRVENWGTAN